MNVNGTELEQVLQTHSNIEPEYLLPSQCTSATNTCSDCDEEWQKPSQCVTIHLQDHWARWSFAALQNRTKLTVLKC